MSKLSLAITAVKTFAKSPLANPTTGKAMLTLSRNAPTILTYAGVTGMVGSTVLACREVFEAHHTHSKHQGERIRMKMFVEAHPGSDEEKTFKRDLTRSYFNEACGLAKVFAPAVTVGALSITSILVGHNMLNKRHAALGAAYLTLQNSYNEYRETVKEALGEDTERELRIGLAQEAKGEDDKGRPKTGADLFSPYAKFFTVGNINYTEGDTTWNVHFLRTAQNHMNDKLYSRGYVFLNDVYKALGFPETKAGQIVGWTSSTKNGDNDGFIDFGVWDEKNQKAMEFVNGYEDGIWLDFNVDGDIMSNIRLTEF